MTHDELPPLSAIDRKDKLLAKIGEKEPGTLTYSNGEIFHSTRRLVSWQLALRAVVELHKPIEDNRCEACYREEYFGGRHLEIGKYPCPTIQSIEKEFG